MKELTFGFGSPIKQNSEAYLGAAKEPKSVKTSKNVGKVVSQRNAMPSAASFIRRSSPTSAGLPGKNGKSIPTTTKMQNGYKIAVAV